MGWREASGRDKVGDEIIKMAWIVQDLILRDLNFIQ